MLGHDGGSPWYWHKNPSSLNGDHLTSVAFTGRPGLHLRSPSPPNKIETKIATKKSIQKLSGYKNMPTCCQYGHL